MSQRLWNKKKFTVHSSNIKMTWSPKRGRHPEDTYFLICVSISCISLRLILNQVSITFVLRKPFCSRWALVSEGIRGELKMSGEKLQFCHSLSKHTLRWLTSLNFQFSQRLSGRTRNMLALNFGSGGSKGWEFPLIWNHSRGSKGI